MRRKGFWISAGLLIVPVVIFYILGSGVQNYKKLPVLGPRILPGVNHNKDTIYYTVPDFEAWDQTGKTITKTTFADRVYVASFFSAKCNTDCATMSRRLTQVYEKYIEFTEVQFISFSTDPDDSIPQLARYAEKYKADPNIWHFAICKKNTIDHIKYGFLFPDGDLAAIEPKHYTQLVLVDKANHIRGIYDSASEADVLQLQDDLKVLLYEYHQPGL
ncbi:MAG: SCO family protein [Bacteroidia bacterium]|nr:SCO family protein [Bacteroidia bacterium]